MDGFPARNSEFKALKGSPLVGSCVNNSSPLISRRKIDVAKDMEALILSRQDDPFLQVSLEFYHHPLLLICINNRMK